MQILATHYIKSAKFRKISQDMQIEELENAKQKRGKSGQEIPQICKVFTYRMW